MARRRKVRIQIKIRDKSHISHLYNTSKTENDGNGEEQI